MAAGEAGQQPPEYLDEASAGAYAERILPSLHRAYPSKIAHVLRDVSDVAAPAQLTPAFYGCFDWHSAVHSHWAVLRLARAFPEASWAAEVHAAVARSLTPENVAAELRYLEPRSGFEMPYGIAWLLQLCADADAYRPVLAPLERLAVERFSTWCSRLSHPIRAGEHGNSAFAMGLVLDYARAVGSTSLEALLVERSRELYGADVAAPLAYAPSAHDFLSPRLCEADRMRRALSDDAWPQWYARFMTEARFTPVTPVDRSDGKLAHFDGLNLSRAWMLRRLGHTALSRAHARVGLQGARSEDYAGAHWLGSFAVYFHLCA